MSDEKNFKYVAKGLGLCAAALILGVCFIAGVKQFKNADRQVSVRGLCEKEVKADRAIYPLVFQVGNDNLVALAEDVAKKNGIVVDFLKKNGFSDDEITVAPPKVNDRSMYSGSNQHSYTYIMTSVVTVYTTKVDKVLELQAKQSALLEQGIAISSGESWENPVTFSFEGLNNIKPGMIAEANKNAREAAQQFAKDSDSKLGRIKDATQGLFTIENRDQNTPQVKTVRVVTYVTYQLK
ncbi:MAG: SIMPL domain-containing protein [Bacteroidales bacterium]|nr:SIMPL domain-containing protein [Bacteroidales bacterium]